LLLPGERIAGYNTLFYSYNSKIIFGKFLPEKLQKRRCGHLFGGDGSSVTETPCPRWQSSVHAAETPAITANMSHWQPRL
jgi:hypothetical protein